MKPSTGFKFHSFILLVMLALTGCTKLVSTTSPKQTSATYPTSILFPSPTLVPKVTANFPPTYTPRPTLLPEKEQGVAIALQSEDCILPCYLGITPGKTKINDGRAILSNLGGSYLGDYQRNTDGAYIYSYTFYIGNQYSEEVFIYHRVSLISDNDLVQILEVGAGTRSPVAPQKGLDLYRENWQRYSTRQIFLQLGQPDQLYSYKSESKHEFGSYLTIVYKKLHIMIELLGTGRENHICPKNEARYIYMNMSLSYSGSSISIEANGKVPPTSREVYLPIEEILGVNTDEFFNQVIADPSVCFER